MSDVGQTAVEVLDDPDSTADEVRPRRVAYLLGAGATHGSVVHAGGTRNLLMNGLRVPIAERLRDLVGDSDSYDGDLGIESLVNEISQDSTDIEQVITFLGESVSAKYRKFAGALRSTFSEVLREELDAATEEIENDRHVLLYSALVDMHQLRGAGEELLGFLSLNYDVFLEQAIFALGLQVDYGIRMVGVGGTERAIRVLKMHGSFGWVADWPISIELAHTEGLWIPPGVRKTKTDYPFNAIWGMAREMLDCDVLRIVGCNLSANDWDLVSMLFTTMHTRSDGVPYSVEIIDRLTAADGIKTRFPYLGAKSLVELDGIGEQIVGEILGIDPQPYEGLDQSQKDAVLRKGSGMPKNPFEHWLTVKAEGLAVDLDELGTPTGKFIDFVNLVSS